METRDLYTVLERKPLRNDYLGDTVKMDPAGLDFKSDGWVDGISPGSCPFVEFGIGGVDNLHCVAFVLI
jgi:hypothetical protein